MILIDLNAVELTKEAEKLLGELKDFTPILKRIANATEALITQTFRAEGPGWVPLSEATLDQRPNAGAGAKILRDTGRLFQSLASSTDGSIYELTDNLLVYGTNLEYAAVHQFGSRDGRIPPRPYLPDEKELGNLVSRQVVAHFRRRK